MKFAKVLEQTLIEEDIPEEWIEAAIQYKSLKKCINKVVSELQCLGLEQNTLKLIIDDKTKQQVVEMNNNEYTPSNPVVAEYTLTKSNFGQSDHIIPMLKISIDYNNADFSDDHINEVWLRLKSKIETLIGNEDSIIESVSNRIYELNEDKSLVLSPRGSRREGSPIPEDYLEQIAGETLDNSSKRSEMLIMLKSDSQFFQMLNGELESLDKLKQDEESKLIDEVKAISESMQQLANPAKGPLRKSDLYKWRELFKIYLDSEVYFKYNETSVSASERDGEQVKRNLNEFISRVEKTSLTDQFKNKKSMAAFNQFLNMNFHLLKVLQFQSINSTAFRKILKKFDKQTSLGVKYKFPKLISSDHIFITGSSIAQSICYVIQSSILTLVPQLDDYTCPICTSVAFKPIKLSCGHIFCVRCLVKLKQQKKVDCPICRRNHAIAYADSSNLDLDSMALMKRYFPIEVKEKLKERDKERYGELVGDNNLLSVKNQPGAMTMDKQSRYDRQLRLWGNSGQSNLESSHICLINATSTGSELLKNLVLPGIGEFTIIDNSEVTDSSLSGNFFLAHQDLGDNTARAMVRELKELNSEVVGNAIEDSLANVLKNESLQFWDSFNIVIISNFVPEEGLNRLKDILWDKNIPLFLVNTMGFYGSLQLILKETTVIETHDPAKFFDLRIDHTWPELQEYVDSIKLDELDDTEHAHVPYIVIFIKALQSWKASHNDIPPRNYQEKNQFRKHVEAMSRNINYESNFIEALKAIHRALQVTQIPQAILELFEDENIKDENINLTTSIFWIYVKALKNFVGKTNQLPLPYAVPDMASDTVSYITLQNIYRNKAINDQKLFTEEVKEILNSIGRTSDDINHDSILSFCKNTQFLYVTKGSKKLFNQKMRSAVLSETDEESSDILNVHFAILVFNSYIHQFHIRPSIQDLDQFIDVFKRFYADPSSKVPDALITTFKEILSHPSPDYHNISSLLGGIASQEILKITTSQYTPLDNLYVFDGIHSISEKWKI